MDFIINLPQNIKIVVWLKNKSNIINIFLYNQNKSYKLFLKIDNYKNNLKIDHNSNTIIIKHALINKNNNKILNFFFDFLKSWNLYFFKKLKFKGKGFRIRFLKKNKFVKFFFGRSHKTFIFFKKIFLKKINKYKFILKSINKNKLNLNGKYVTNIKPLNVYTLRGLRASKQIIFKRKGKKGTYI